MSAAVLRAAVLTPGQRYRVELLGRVRTRLALEAHGDHRGIGGHRGVGSQPSVQVSAPVYWHACDCTSLKTLHTAVRYNIMMSDR